MSKLIPASLVADPEHFDSRMPAFPKPLPLVEPKEINEAVAQMKSILERNKKNLRNYFMGFILCEILNTLNVIVQIFFTDVFLGGLFGDDDAFPKVSKCTFRKVGASGTPQVIDGICVLSINIFNEKIYAAFWPWLLIMLVLGCLQLCYRALQICCTGLRRARAKNRVNGLTTSEAVDNVFNEMNASEAFFLLRLGVNLDSRIFAKLINEMDKTIQFRNTHNGNGIRAENAEKGFDTNR